MPGLTLGPLSYYSPPWGEVLQNPFCHTLILIHADGALVVFESKILLWSGVRFGV